MDYAFQCLINRLSDKLLSAIYFNFLSTRIFMISIRNLQKFQRFSDFREWQEIVKVCKSNFCVINMAPKFIFLLWDISRYLKT